MSVRPLEVKPRRVGGWMELALLAAGLSLIWVSLGQQREWLRFSSWRNAAALVLGLLLAAAGLRRLWTFGWKVAVRSVGPLARRRYRVHVQREAYIAMLILLVIGFGAMLTRSNLLLLVFGLMAGPFVLGGQVTLLILKRLQITRQLPDFAVAGRKFPVRVRLANRKPLLSAWMILAGDTVGNGREKVQGEVLFARVPPWGEREAIYTVCPATRGRYRFGPLRVTCGFPLGLVARSYVLGETQELVVYPRIGRVTDGWNAASSETAHAGERALAVAGVFDEDFHRLREYRGGDNPRTIHWRTTARRNELMVREYQHHSDPDLWLAVDLWQPDRATDEDRRRVELAVSVAATLCAERSQSSGDVDVHLLTCGERLSRMSGGNQPLALRSLLEHLALIEPGPSPPLSEALLELARVRDPCRKALITTRPTSAALADALRRNPESQASLGSLRIIHCDPQQVAEIMDFNEPR